MSFTYRYSVVVIRICVTEKRSTIRPLPLIALIQERANGSKYSPPIEDLSAVHAAEKYVLCAGEFLKVSSMKPPEKHCSIITIKERNFGSFAISLPKSLAEREGHQFGQQHKNVTCTEKS
ncbi:hypothetical protein HR10_10285 [Porphyromonas gulae]|uniref:Uncharacterized protein n=1 Tax=Porphyromonas gulae TaxID=111105 RepID=A0A0A2EZ06_9PORP|nr:hypothetical protein HR15_11390 [Porphyromonas gulae]KKC50201.1 hypothetical protein HR10_10285 [Porphyromonas gulae]